MALLGECEVHEHRVDLGVLVILERFDADVVGISHWQPLWLLRARRPRCRN